MVTTSTLGLQTSGQGDTHDVTPLVAKVLSDASIRAGLATISVVGSTAAVTTIEFEPGAVADLHKVFEHLAPRQGDYRHHLQWGDDNGSSHVRAALMGPSLSVPFVDGRLLLGTWQQIVLIEFDTRPRDRQFIVQLMGE